MTDLVFPQFRVHGGPRDRLQGLFLKDGGLDGWGDLPDGEGDSVTRSGTHGAYDLPIYRPTRVVSGSGWGFAASSFELEHMADLVRGVGGDGELVKMIGISNGISRYVRGRVMSARFVDSEREGEVRWGSFVINLECRDPRKYGERRVFEGTSVMAFHYGNVQAVPVVEVPGPRVNGYTLAGPGGRSVVVRHDVPAGQVSRVDFRTGRVTLNGSLQVGVLEGAAFWTLPAGRRTPMSINSGVMRVLVDDTYM